MWLFSFSYVTIILILLFILFLLWVFWGRGNYTYNPFANISEDDLQKFILGQTCPNADQPKITKQYQEILPLSDKYNLQPYVPNEFLIEDLKAAPRKNKFQSIGEKRCIEVMKEIYGVDFYTVRPNWLKNPETGHNLELDCYNDQLKIAVEYNGIQHYLWPNFTNNSREEFMAQIRRDNFKVEQCDRNGVYLITVPYTVPVSRIKDYIIYYLPENVKRRIDENIYEQI